MFTRDEMVALLREGTCEVVFEKANGDERSMVCTLKADLLPFNDAERVVENKAIKKKENTNVIAVYDTKAPGWRSFRVDSVKEFKIT